MSDRPTGAYGRLLGAVEKEVGRLYEQMPELAVTRVGDPAEIRRHLRDRFDFRAPWEVGPLIEEVGSLLQRWSVQVTHPRYFGLFNPTPRPVTVAADALTAIYNPQLAVWDHAPAANEMEAHVLRYLTGVVGFDPDASHASFTSGGQESNHTAMIAALAHRFPGTSHGGLRGLASDPVLYVSRDGHHSIEKAASATGLGRGAVRRVAVDADRRMDPGALERKIREDRGAGRAPFLVVATAGTTGAGLVDPLEEIGTVAREEGLWLHVDAAWAGSALLSRRLRPLLAGVGRADSFTWDAHKWLWAPVGTGMFFTRHPDAVQRAFDLRAGYVPVGTPDTTDRITTTLQWSRRFIGLRVFMTLAELGADGVEALVDHQAGIGDLLRRRLRDAGWTVVNRTPLPLVCFTHPRIEDGRVGARDVARRVGSSGRAWVSGVTLPGRDGSETVLRACVTSYRTDDDDVDVLVDELERALTA
jgi:glutamate/tyrosine decarboxylase-like PLP-dependent enzyme